MFGYCVKSLFLPLFIRVSLSQQARSPVRGHPYMTSAKFLDFLTPSLPCPHLGLIYSTKFTQPPLQHLLLGQPPSPLPADVVYGCPPRFRLERSTYYDGIYYDWPVLRFDFRSLSRFTLFFIDSGLVSRSMNNEKSSSSKMKQSGQETCWTNQNSSLPVFVQTNVSRCQEVSSDYVLMYLQTSNRHSHRSPSSLPSCSLSEMMMMMTAILQRIQHACSQSVLLSGCLHSAFLLLLPTAATASGWHSASGCVAFKRRESGRRRRRRAFRGERTNEGTNGQTRLGFLEK